MFALPAILASAAVQGYLACGMRAAGLMMSAPPPIGGSVPLALRTALVLALAVLLGPVAAPAAAARGAVELSLWCAADLGIGLLAGLPLRLVFEALRHAGEAFAGLAIPESPTSSSLLDGEQSSASGQLAVLAALGVMLVAGAERSALTALRETFSTLPPGTWPDSAALAGVLTAMGQSYFSLVLSALMPLAALVLAIDGAIAAGGRALGGVLLGDALGAGRALAMLLLLAASAPAVFGPAAVAGFEAALPARAAQGVSR